MERLTEEDVAGRLSRLPGWTLESGALQRQFTFESFPDVIAFLTRLGFAAEEADHHPDVTISYRRVTLRYVTHSAKALTEKDFAGAEAATAIAGKMGGG